MWLKTFNRELAMIYENIDLIHTGKRSELVDDIENRTGLKVHSFEVEKINYLTDTANIKVYYE